MDLVGK